MATTTKKKPVKKKVDTSAKVKSAYKEFLLLQGEEPASVFAFAKELKIAESKFYDHFSSFNAIKQEIWNDYIVETLEILNKDDSYNDFTVREKLLSFYYTFLELLKRDRSFVTLCFNGVRKTDVYPEFLKQFKKTFEGFGQQLVNEGVESGEIQERPIIGKKYNEALWLQLLFVINFWLRDNSKKFEGTDAAVEKAVTLSFDLMGPGPLDSMIDFAKFLYHNR